MSDLAIVAIPEEQDIVWKISSQKVPHLTLCNLGPMTADKNVGAMASFLEHVANTTMDPFGLSVDYRGELGPNNADVLFFDTFRRDWLKQIRAFLLTQPDIHKAYMSTPQFPDYIPHLTLGFPDDPAHEDTRDNPGIHWVQFDRVALWTSDFDGPTFRLPKHDWRSEVSWSDEADKFLAHFGVKGMRWGVRKDRSGGGHGGSDDHNNATAARAKAKKGGVKSLSNKELQDMITRMNLEQQYVRLAPPSKGAIIMRKGSQVVGEILIGVGKSQATKLLNDQATKLVAQALKK
jgi:2'-5' RNA ligase